ncbi:glycoside hydrolase family 2 protein [Actinacidiphila acididurans]|uniref:Discoidin domain-containing protein n=1 Tax=Actinacidiphila acididurans TaxID=2784346 RepID=A0ABS2TV78_9ACTN|nr:sugar-binding domain-containing protein [Actinacidiphila acididurans]MBM9507243.1 discoidin domain-containing protein [Actinacidiphila acididurans]
MNQPNPPRRQHHGGELVPTRRQILTVGAATAAALGLSRLGTAQAATPGPQTDGGRVLQSLNGTWDFLPTTTGAAYPPPATGWATIPVPAEWNMSGGPFSTPWGAYDLFETPTDWNSVDAAWYRRDLTVPASSKGRRIVLRFEAVNFESTVYAGGVQVAHHAEGLLPFEADITDQVTFGGTTTVHVLVRSPNAAARQGDGYHHPAGSWWGQYAAGIWQDVWLLSRDQVSVADTAVVTSVADGTLTATTTLRNDGPAARTVRVDHTVWDGARQVLRVPGQVTVPAGGTAQIRPGTTWRDARLWSPEDPHLYELRVDVRDTATGPVLDSATTRFGFREVTVDGVALELNGRPLLLRGDSWHYMGSVQNSRAYAEMWMSMAKAAGVNYMRLHAMPYPPVYYDVADEMGMLIVGESGIYGSSGNYAMNAADFWDNCATHLGDRVARDRNHPSIIAWSAENEMLAAFGQSWAAKVAALKPAVVAADTSRPVYFEGDGDPQGAGDLRSTHYPLEITTHDTAIPETGRALAPGQSRGNEWDRKKPFLISEFSSMYYANPADVSAIGGPAAYADTDGLWAAHALTLRAQIEGFRLAGITAISPWNTVWYGMQPLPFDGTSVPTADPSGSGPVLRRVGRYAATLNPGFQQGIPAYRPNPIHGAVARTFAPIAAYAMDYRTHAYGGATFSRDLLLCNDTAEDATLTVHWQVRGNAGLATRNGHTTVTVPATGRTTITTTLDLPQVTKDAPATWRVTVEQNGERRFTDKAALTVYAAAPALGVPLRAAVLEGASGAATTKALAALGVTTRTLADLSALPDPASGEVLVIAEGYGAAATADDRTRVTQFVAAGGQVLVLAQSALPQILPWPQFTVGTPQTITHPVAPHHPVLAGLDADDLRWWQTPNELAVSTLLLKPRFGSLLSLADAGPALAASALAEARYGNGRYLLCQYPVVAAQAAEPIAAKLLGNLLRALADRPAATRTTAVLGAANSPVVPTLKAASVAVSTLTSIDVASLSGLGVLVVDAAPGNETALASLKDHASDVSAWVAKGGTLWINGATPATWPSVAGFLPPAAALSPVDATHQHGAVVTGDSPLTSGINNADLDWPGSGSALAGYTVTANGGTAAATTRAVAWSSFSAGNEQTKYGRALDSTLGFTPGAVLWQGASGSGTVLVDQLKWPSAAALPVQVGLAALLAANTGAAFSAGSGSGELPTDGWKGFTNPASSDPANAFDRNPSTRWSSDALQKPGMYYGLDLGAVRRVTRVVWDTSGSSSDYPRGVDVQVSTDNSTWTTVLSIPDTGSYVAGGVLVLTFDPVDARYLKFVDTGSAPGNYLSLHEIYVYQPAS